MLVLSIDWQHKCLCCPTTQEFMRHDLLRHVQLKHSNSISALQQKGLPIVKTAERQNPPFKAYSRRVYVRTAERQHSPFKP